MKCFVSQNCAFSDTEMICKSRSFGKRMIGIYVVSSAKIFILLGLIHKLAIIIKIWGSVGRDSHG